MVMVSEYSGIWVEYDDQKIEWKSIFALHGTIYTSNIEHINPICESDVMAWAENLARKTLPPIRLWDQIK